MIIAVPSQGCWKKCQDKAGEVLGAVEVSSGLGAGGSQEAFLGLCRERLAMPE